MNQPDPVLKSPQQPRSAAAGGPCQVDEDQLRESDRKIKTLGDSLAAAEEREGMLQHELQHRVRNLLAVIRSVYRQSREMSADLEDFADHFEGRLNALARLHSTFLEIGTRDIELEDIVRDELLETRCQYEPNTTITGPAVCLQQKSAEMMGLAIHELTTNSTKFGALSQGGKLSVEWSVTQAGEPSALLFRWKETGISAIGPAPRRSGFGRQLIEEALPYQLGATATFELRPGSFECSILLPLSSSIDNVVNRYEAAASEAELLPSESE